MRNSMPGTLAACLLGFIWSGNCLAGIQYVLKPEARATADGRDVLIIVPQAEIKTSIRTNAIGMPGLIDIAIDDAHAKSAEKTIVPLREALAGYDFDALVQKESAATLATIDWFGLKDVRLSKEMSESGVLSALKGANTAQVLFLTYSYSADPIFSSIVVDVRAKLVNKEMPKKKPVPKAKNPPNPMMRFWPKYVPFDRSVRSAITLPNADKWHPENNVQAWSADGGKLARAALDLGVERCHLLLSQALQMSAKEFDALSSRHGRKMINEPGVTGWIVESDANHMVVYSAQNHWTTYAEKAGVATAKTGAAAAAAGTATK